MIDRILSLSIRHRWVVLFLTLAAALFGAYTLKKLPIDAVPDITNNQVQINALAPGLSPEEVEKQVTYPIEHALAGIPGLESTRSLSRSGFSQVTAIFDDSVNVYFARAQINERLAEAKELLPEGVEPKMGPISTGLGEIAMWTVEFKHPEGNGTPATDGKPGWQSDGSYLTVEKQRLTEDFEKAAYLRTVQDWIIRPQLKGIPGLADVDSIGGFVKQYHVNPDPALMQGMGLKLSDLKQALETNNRTIGAGYIETNGQALMVKSEGRLRTIEDVEQVVVSTHKGVPVRVADIAKVGIGKEMRTGSASENGREVVIGTAMMLIGSNSRTVSQAVVDKLAEINRTLPADVQAKIILNRTTLVDATISTVAKNLSEGALLVIAVLFVLLGNLRAALIAACIIPLSMLLTSIGMVESRISGNLMSLGALDFGLIVDGAIIITENCLRRLGLRTKELGRALTEPERLDLLLQASKEMVKPTVFGQAIIMIVYIPLLTFTGIEGKMFEPMALTVLFALGAAFVLSLTFTPAMIALFVRETKHAGDNAIVRALKRLYAPVLQRIIHDPLPTLLVSALLVAASFTLFTKLGQEFVPTLDEGDIALHAVRIPSASLTQSTAMQLGVEEALAKFPQVAFVFSKTGTAEMASDPMPPNVSDTFVMLRPRAEWPNPHLSKDDLIAEMEEELWQLPGNNYEFTQPIEMRFNELIAGVRSDVAVKIYGDKFEEMQRLGGKIASVLNQVPGAADVKAGQTDGLPTLDIVLNETALERLNLSRSDVMDVISLAIGGEEAGYLLEGDRRFELLIRLAEEKRSDLASLGELPIPLPNSGSTGSAAIPLSEIASLKISEGLNEITRENGKRVLIVEANVRGRDVGAFVEDASARIKQKVAIPPGNWLGLGGQFENLLSARAHLLIVVPVCFAVIFGLLVVALQSVPLATIVFSGVPLAISGGIITLYLRGIPFSVSAAVGFIALSGIAVLNGLVMLTCIKENILSGQKLDAAVFEGAMARLRPVLMTALVASLGFLPMALATGTGAEVQKPLATVVIGGLISATLLTLLVLPALCVFSKRVYGRIPEESGS